MAVGEAIAISLRELYSGNLTPEIKRSAMQNLFTLAVTNVYFNCNGIWYVQSDGLAMGARLTVKLPNLWMKSFDGSLQKPELSENISKSDQNGNCKHCDRRGIFRRKGKECESYKN